MIFSHVPIKVKRSEVLRYLGYKKSKSESTEEIDALIDTMIKKAAYSIAPQGISKHLTITSKNIDTWEIACDHGTYVIQGEKIYKHLENCQQVTLIAVTIGEQIDKEIDQYFYEKEPTKALIMDAIGSDAAERVADYVNEYVTKDAARKGYGTKFRFSPGYGGWTVENQQDLIRQLDSAQIGIRVSEHSQLMPRKSVSAVIGWYTKNNTEVKQDDNTESIQSDQCKRCGLSDCQFQDE